MIRSSTIRLKVNAQQGKLLDDLLEHLCVLYNSALDHRKRNWAESSTNIAYYDQQRLLTEFRRGSPEVAEFPVVIQRDPLRRIDAAFKSFFRRAKEGGAPGYPRFKARTQYDSFSVDSQNFRIKGDTLVISKLGEFRFKTRCKMLGDPVTLHVTRKGNRYLANVVFDRGEAKPKVAVASAVGIDLGIKSLATLSDGTDIANPRWLKREQANVAFANRALNRKVRGSKNRAKAKERLRRVHVKIAGRRSSYVTSVAKVLFEKYDLIAHEALTIKHMVQSRFGKSIHDAAWARLIERLQCEAENAGKWLIPVNPRNTTKTCSQCGDIAPKSISQRIHSCPKCGLLLDRDHNAAINILRLGESLVARQNGSIQPNTAPHHNESKPTK